MPDPTRTTPVSLVDVELDARFQRHGLDASPSGGFRPAADAHRNDHDPAIRAAVTRAQTGDTEAIGYLYVRYRNSIYGYVLSILRDDDEAEDVTQHVFLKLISAIRQYEPRKVPFTAWIIRVARNAAVTHQRRRRSIPVEEVYESSRAVDDVDISRRSGLTAALENLSDDQRNVVVLRHLVGLSPGEIAQRMDRTEASVHGLHHRARQALVGELEGGGFAPTTRRSRPSMTSHPRRGADSARPSRGSGRRNPLAA